jgi:hypothetical protein
MRRIGLLGLALALALELAVVIHLGWHFSMPGAEPSALRWPQHWILPALTFFATGGVIVRAWKSHPGPVALAVVLLAILVAQGVLPVLEFVLVRGRFGYSSDPARWQAFFLYLGIGVPALLAGVQLLRPHTRTRTSPSAA